MEQLDLHPFPTRRSSDLATRVTNWTLECSACEPARTRDRDGFPGVCEVCGSHTPGNPSRSEEHTSELQSRRDLVCRPLLEKKHATAHILRHCTNGGPGVR